MPELIHLREVDISRITRVEGQELDAELELCIAFITSSLQFDHVFSSKPLFPNDLIATQLLSHVPVNPSTSFLRLLLSTMKGYNGAWIIQSALRLTEGVRKDSLKKTNLINWIF